MSGTQMKSYTLAEVQQHNTAQDCWIIIDNDVYDVTKFIAMHPGGKSILISSGGKDVSAAFHLYHNPSILPKFQAKLKIGTLSNASVQPRRTPTKPKGTFGDMVAYGDPLWYQRFNSPYYKETHRVFRQRVRHFVDTEVMPHVIEWRDLPTINDEIKSVYLKMGKEGFLACMLGAPFPKDYVDPGTPCPDQFDAFHELILFDEFMRVGNSAIFAALTNGPSIAMSAVWAFGTPAQKRQYLPDIVMGRKFCALAISEAGAGSDVAGLTCTATKQGDVYVVNGSKKWITNGTYADVFVTAVVTSKSGHGGLSMLVIDRNTPGFSIRKVKVRGSDLSGTAFLDFDQCRVPAANLIGKENNGFKLIMNNFNHERMYITISAIRLSRICLEESIKYALKRKTFGKYLHEHQSIRMKVASMVRRIECLQAWLESVVYQMTTMSHTEAQSKCGDVMCLVKAEASKVYELCAREATHIFGGNALYVGGMGDRIEGAVQQVKAYQIPAGAEDVMDDFGARTAFRLTQGMAKL